MALPAVGMVIAGALSYVATHLASKVIVHLGLGVVTYVGIDILIQKFQNFAFDQLNGLPQDLLQFTKLLGFDTAIAMIFSAITVRWTLGGLFSSSVSRWFVQGRE